MLNIGNTSNANKRKRISVGLVGKDWVTRVGDAGTYWP